MLTKEQAAILEKIKNHFDHIEGLYNQLDLTAQEFINNYHNEHSNLPHCIRWGQQAAEELLKEDVVFELCSQFKVNEEIIFEDGYVPAGAVATLVQIRYDSLLEEGAKYFQLDFDKFEAYDGEYEAAGTCIEVDLEFIKEHLELLPTLAYERNTIKEYNIPVVWEVTGEVKVRANSLEEAISKAKESDISAGEVIEGSLMVDYGFIVDEEEDNKSSTLVLNDHQMQKWLEEKGHKLYDPKKDNQVDMEELHRLAVSYGFAFNLSKYEWTK